MKALPSLLFFLIGYSHLTAQDSTIATIKTGETANDVLTLADIYYYTQFTNGTVYFRDGTKTVAKKMNYNRLFDQILFIDEKGDTLAVADEKTIKLIAIDKDTFYFDEGYMRLITNTGIVKLAERQVWEMADVRKIGSHNRPATTYAVTSVNSLTDVTARAKSHDLLINQDILLRKETQYFFGDEYNNFVRAGKKKLLLLFPKEHLRLEKYLKENDVQFNKRDDLEKLAQFIGQRH
jgi:hypothetical protein